MYAELEEPPRVLRGTFHMSYAIAKEDRHKARAKWPRLLDCLRCVAQSDDPEYFLEAMPGEFAVVDVVTKEKAWFEMPYGCTPEIVQAMVEGHFAAQAFRVGEKLWLV